MRLTRTQLLLIGVGGVVVILVVVAFGTNMSYRPTIKDMPATTSSGMTYEIADTLAKQELGLGNRTSIADNYGMLFVFPKPGRYGFWMKDMLVPIDMLWLSDNGTIVAVDSSVQPDTYPHIFYPPTPVRYVVETRAEFAHEHELSVGARLPLPSPYGTKL